MKIQINNILPIIDLGKNVEKTIFLSSSARSGSTFFANLLNYKKDYRILFEPWSKGHVKAAKKINFPIYLHINDTEKKYKKFFFKIISGHISNRWIDRENKAGFYTKRLVKEVRSNLFLPWIINNFSEIKVILLLRNPISVINSWNSQKFENGFLLRSLILKEDEFLKNIPENVIKKYKDEEDSFLLSLYYWCMTNSYPSQDCANNEFLTIKYEDLVSKDQITIDRIKNFTGIDISKVSDGLFYKSSSSSDFRKDESLHRLNDQKKSLGNERLMKAQDIIDLFKMNNMYNLI